MASTSADHEDGIVLNVPSKNEWKDGPPTLPKGAKIAVLEGDAGRKGPFVLRVKVPDGYRIPPHTHPKVERVTMKSGTLYTDMGGEVRLGEGAGDADRLIRLLEGGNSTLCLDEG